MSIEMVLYLIDVFASIAAFIKVMLFFSSALTVILMVMMFYSETEIPKHTDDDAYDNRKRKRLSQELTVIKSRLAPLSVALVLSLFFTLFIPSEKTMYMMLASNAAKKSEIPEKVLKAIELKLDEYIDNVTDKVKK